jgi:asparagine synthase (glutamine-hydrolysing)
MSGIVGMYRPDGGPADHPLVRALTHFLAYRGPDARGTWCGGCVAFGHAMLRTTEESAHERQPAGLDGRLWITADARLDARAELLAELGHAGRSAPRNTPDCELILHAYAAWGEQCVQRLRGDFAFGIWDAQRKSLFCARDHFGIKPFYYAEDKNFFLFSNTLDCIRMCPGVADELNEAAIADFLLFGLNCDAATTTFRGIRRLPPAHSLRVSAEGLRIERYWSAPIDGRIRYRHADAYVEHFQMLLREAVADRLRGGRTGIMLSGGMDSSSLAATARELSPERGESGKLRAYTVTYEKLLPDRDGAHAREVAEFLGIPIRCMPMDELRPFERWDDPRTHWPEPTADPLMSGMFDQFRTVAAECRIAFNGEGPDNLMDFQMLPYVRSLLRSREWRRLCVEVPRFLHVRKMPWRGIKQRLMASVGADSGIAGFPKWLAPEFAKRVDAKGRWREGCVPRVAPAHPLKPRAYASMFLPHWTLLFELQDAGVTRCPVDMRYPFLDLRIVEYLFAIPSFPWAFQKTLLREAMAGHLPETVRRRPKTPLPGDPLVARLQQAESVWFDQAKWAEEAERYIVRSAVRRYRDAKSPDDASVAMLPLCLNFWLQYARPIRYKLIAEVSNG